MANVKNLYFIYSDEHGVVGVYTSKSGAQEQASEVEGSVIHTVPVSLQNTPLKATKYVPPSTAVLEYGAVDSFDAEEYAVAGELEEDWENYAENYETVPQDYTPVSTSPNTAPQARKTLSPKEAILARLQAELGVEDEEDIPQLTHVSQAAPVQPRGGYTQVAPNGDGSTEYFSPI